MLLTDRLGGGTWRPVSFEYNTSGWYMPGQHGVSPVGLRARVRARGNKRRACDNVAGPSCVIRGYWEHKA